MRVKEILNNYALYLADIEVILNGEIRSAPTLCVTDGYDVIPLNTPDGVRYDKWAGLYQEDHQFLYVNRGFGFLGYPGRIGIWPEITIMTLLKA